MHLTACSRRGNSKDMSRWNCIAKLCNCLKPTLQSCPCSHSCVLFFVYFVCCFVFIAGFSVLCVILIRDISCSCATMLETYKVRFSEAVHWWWLGSLQSTMCQGCVWYVGVESNKGSSWNSFVVHFCRCGRCWMECRDKWDRFNEGVLLRETVVFVRHHSGSYQMGRVEFRIALSVWHAIIICAKITASN